YHPLPAGDVVMLSVADTGIGMDAATRARIFEPFFTTKPVGQGTGLGLATVYGIIRQSGGNITVFSEPGAGAIFRCYFPRAASPVDDATPDDMPARTRGAETILVAEDEPELRALMKRALERHGYGVLVAADGADALATAARHAGPIHLLLTDMVMPNLSGRQLAEQLTRERPDLRVLIMSGYSTDAIARQGVVLPHSVFLQKPVSPDALARAVRALLDSSVVSGIA
ncbi:MAG: response regulator, partial [Gemmatimonadales bacterium]